VLLRLKVKNVKKPGATLRLLFAKHMAGWRNHIKYYASGNLQAVKEIKDLQNEDVEMNIGTRVKGTLIYSELSLSRYKDKAPD